MGLRISPVTPEDGLVTYKSGKNLRVIWARCPECGPQPPKVEWLKHRNAWGLVNHQERPLGDITVECSKCGTLVPYKLIIIPEKRSSRNEKCNRRCLNGKTYCACHCQGRCHGEGVCYCEPTAKRGGA